MWGVPFPGIVKHVVGVTREGVEYAESLDLARAISIELVHVIGAEVTYALHL